MTFAINDTIFGLKYLFSSEKYGLTTPISCNYVTLRVTVNVDYCRFDPHLRKRDIYLNLFSHFFTLMSKQDAALRSATHRAMAPEFG